LCVRVEEKDGLGKLTPAMAVSIQYDDTSLFFGLQVVAFAGVRRCAFKLDVTYTVVGEDEDIDIDIDGKVIYGVVVPGRRALPEGYAYSVLAG
jgi:hypothetical protein